MLPLPQSLMTTQKPSVDLSRDQNIFMFHCCIWSYGSKTFTGGETAGARLVKPDLDGFIKNLYRLSNSFSPEQTGKFRVVPALYFLSGNVPD